MSAPASRASPIHATSVAKGTARLRIAAASPVSTNCSKRSPILLIRTMRTSKNGRATTIPTHSMSSRSNMPSAALQTAATLPRRDSPRKNLLARLPDRREPTRRGLHRTVTDKHRGLHCSSILSIGQRGGSVLRKMPSGLEQWTFITTGQGHQPAHTHICGGPLWGEPQVPEQNDVTKLYEEFEEAFVDVLTAKSEGVSFSRRMKLRLARSRLRAHKDFTQREYDAAVLRADARAWKILG